MQNSTATMTGEYILFTLAGDCYGIDIRFIREIIRVPTMVRVSFSPLEVLGLTNLRGTIYTVIDMRSALGLELKDESTGSERVLILDDAESLGVLVDEVLEVLELDEAIVEKDREGAEECGFIEHVAHVESTDQLIQIINVSWFIASRMQRAKTNRNRDYSHSKVTRRINDERAMNLHDYLGFVLNNENYLLAIENVKEIVKLPQNISKMGHAQEHILGLSILRDEVLPIVDLGQVLNMAPQEIDTKVQVIVSLFRASDGSSFPVGLVVKEVKDVLSLPPENIEELPLLLKNELKDAQQIAGVYKDKDLSYLLEPESLFSSIDGGVLQLLETDTHRDRVREERSGAESIDEKKDLHNGEQDQYIFFAMDKSIFAIDIVKIQEIVRVPEVTKIPGANSFIAGLINIRGEVIPVLNLQEKFSMARKEINKETRIIVLNLEKMSVGIMVDETKDVLPIEKKMISPPPEKMIESLDGDYFQGIIRLDEENMALMLAPERLLSMDEIAHVQEVALGEVGGEGDEENTCLDS